ncbi:MAG: hypothetical protein WC677_04905 [Clostridia bacterium]|jgi:hypothetical protein
MHRIEKFLKHFNKTHFTNTKFAFIALTVIALSIGAIFLSQCFPMNVKGYSNISPAKVNYAANTKQAQSKSIYKTSSVLLAFDSQRYLHRIMPKTDITQNLKKLKNVILHFKNKKYNTAFVMVPSSVVKGKTKLPSGITDYQNTSADKALAGLKSAGIKTLDLRSEFIKNYLDPQRVFFNTDHHWKIPQCVYAAKIISKYLNTSFKLNLDPKKVYTNYDNYTATKYVKSYSGSFMRIAGKSFVGSPDDFISVVPKFKTNYRLRCYTSKGKIQYTNGGKKMDYSGPFTSTLYDGRKSYTGYFKGGLTELVVNNYWTTNKLKCMVIGTSMGRGASAFLAQYFKELRFVDSQGGRFSKNLYNYVDSYKPDVVLFVYAGFSFENKYTFSYHID